MTYRKDMSNQNDYSTMNKSDLANAYLFGELSENDSEVEKTINEYLNQNDLKMTIKNTSMLEKYKKNIFGLFLFCFVRNTTKNV